MSFAEEAELKLSQMIVKNRNSSFSKLEKNSRGESVVIRFLEHLEQPTSPKKIAETMHLSSARVATILGSLEKKGFIKREISPEDRRRITVTLTDLGKQEAILKGEESKAKIIQVFEKMGEEDTSRLVELMEEFFHYSEQILDEEEG